MKNKNLRTSVFPFVLYHAAIIVFCGIVCLASPRSVSTNFMDVIPHTGFSKGIARADKMFTASQNSSVNVLVSSESFEKAKQCAADLYGEFSKSGIFENVKFENIGFDTDALRNFVTDNVYLLLDDETQAKIRTDAQAFCDDSLASIFSGFTFSSMDVLDRDPFLLNETVWISLLEKLSDATDISPKDNVLAVEQNGIWYVMLSGNLTQEKLNVADKNAGAGIIFKLGEKAEKTHPDVKIYYSGVPFHSYESSQKAQKEISVITIFSVLCVIVLFVVLCRNFHVLELFVLSLCLSLVSAVGMLLVCFKNFHIMTLIFGTSLIGTCIDYSIHFYLRYAKKEVTENAYDVRKKLIKSLSVGFGSTALCFLLLLFSSYSVLRQISIFSTAGLLSSYVTVLFLFPKIVTEKSVNPNSLIVKNRFECKNVPYVLPIFAVVFTAIFVCRLPHIKIKNDITNLYMPSERLLEGESKFASIMGYSDTSYAIVEADSPQAVLEAEADFVSKIGNGAKVLGTSIFIPTVSQQKKSIEAAQILLPYVDEQADVLGLSEAEKSALKNKIKNLRPNLTTDTLPSEIASLLSAFSIGKIGDKYYEVAVIRDAENPEKIGEIADECDGVFYIRTARDISRQLDLLTKKILMIFGIGFVLIGIMLIFAFGFKEGLRIALAPFTVVAATVAVCNILGFALDFFFAVGLVLVIGFGLDYIVFASEKKASEKKVSAGKRAVEKGTDKKRTEEKTSPPMFAVTLSFVTTELSFGSLMFSSFRPVHIFGLTVFVGILFAYVCAFFGRQNEKFN